MIVVDIFFVTGDRFLFYYHSPNTKYYVELKVIHHFCEGNGHGQRGFCLSLLLLTATMLVSFNPVSQEKWIQANIASYYADYKPLALDLPDALNMIPAILPALNGKSDGNIVYSLVKN